MKVKWLFDAHRFNQLTAITTALPLTSSTSTLVISSRWRSPCGHPWSVMLRQPTSDYQGGPAMPCLPSPAQRAGWLFEA
ncbi:MAG: hypothetical protein ACLSH6_08310 [Limosilactobacillus pontis]